MESEPPTREDTRPPVTKEDFACDICCPKLPYMLKCFFTTSTPAKSVGGCRYIPSKRFGVGWAHEIVSIVRRSYQPRRARGRWRSSVSKSVAFVVQRYLSRRVARLSHRLASNRLEDRRRRSGEGNANQGHHFERCVRGFRARSRVEDRRGWKQRHLLSWHR